MPRFELRLPGTPDRPGINPFTKQSMTIPGKPGKHYFREIEQRGAEVHVCSGSVGGWPARYVRRHADEAGARAAFDALVAECKERRFLLTGEATRMHARDADPVAIELRAEVIDAIGESVRLSYDSYEDEGDPPLADTVYAVLRHPKARALRELTIGLNSDDGTTNYQEIIAAIGAGAPASLETLFVGDFEFPDETEISWAVVGDCDPLWTLPSLRKLTLQGAGIELGVVDAPSLVTLEIRTGGLPRSSVESLMAARLPALETLAVWFGSSDYGAGGGVSELGPLFEGSAFPALRHLGIQNAEFTDEACEALLASKILPRLESLDLSMGTLTDAGAAKLRAGAAKLAHLRRLVVGQNLLTDAGVAMLDGIARTVDFGNQRGGGPEDRYVAVGE